MIALFDGILGSFYFLIIMLIGWIYSNQKMGQGKLNYKYYLPSSVVLSGNQTNDFTCVEILAVNDICDLDLLKNEICVRGTTNRLFLKAFPNPTTQDLFVEMVVPAKGDIVARVYDNMGKEQAYLFGESREKGFYRFKVPSAEFMNGMYYLIVDYKGAKYKLPFIKQ